MGGRVTLPGPPFRIFMSYLSLAELKEYLDVTESTDDNLLQHAINTAKMFFDNQTHRTFETGPEEVEKFSPVMSTVNETLFLNRDLLTVSDVSIGGVTVVTDDFVLQPLNGLPKHFVTLRATSGLNWFEDFSEDSISVTGVWAFSAEAPPDVIECNKILASHFYKRRESIDSTADRDIMSPTGLILMAGNIPKDARKIIDYYRRRVP